MASISEARILISYKGTNRKLCKIFFSKADASVYIAPYSYANQYYYGKGSMPENVQKLDMNFVGQFYTDNTPKVSIHQKGQVHIKGRAGQAGPIFIPKLDKWHGQHLATVMADNFDVLPKHTKSLKSEGRAIDIVMGWNQNVDGGKIVLFADSGGKNFPSYCDTFFTLKRPTILTNLHIGVGALGFLHIKKKIPEPGMSIIAGWDPTKPSTLSNEFLYIRGL